MRVLTLISSALLAAIPTASQATDSNVWRINAAIGGRNFNMDCRLDSAAGTCTRTNGGGKTYKLASFSEAGNRKSWSIKARAMLTSITIAFNGQANGDRMAGTMTIAGRAGTFTAVRQ